MEQLSMMWKKMRIKNKIICAYVILLMLSFALSLSILYGINSAYTKQEIGNAGTQTVSALKGNLSLIFDNVTQFSDLVYFDDSVQESLRNVQAGEINPNTYKTIRKSLVNMILSGDYVSGVFIKDSYGNFYSSYKKAPKKVHPEKIKDTNWYKNLPSYNGNGHFIHGSEGIIEYYMDTNYITYIREIRDENTYEPLATLMLTVNEDSIRKYFDDVAKTYNSNFFIVDGNNEFVVGPKTQEQEIKSYIKEHGWDQDKTYSIEHINGQQVFLVSQDLGIQDWTLVGLFQGENIKLLAPYYSTIVVVVIFLNILFAFISSMMLTKLIFRPLSKVEKHMLMVEQGLFVAMELDQQSNEISNLKRVYNHMITSISDLILKVKEEEKIIARGELDLLQAQINPHFLYNTLDAVSALALMKDYDNCFKMTQALGSFYRNSLNSGKNFISIGDEVECIKSYLTILNIRYENKIKVEFEVEESILECEIIKLLLQPLVKNAVHHGIKLKDESGTIWIQIFSNDDEINVIVADDGEGMSEERVKAVLSGEAVTGKSGFGIASLIQRITLYYGIQHPLMIHSEVGNGTEIAVRIKRKVPGGN